jgi:hypothetical protein
MIKVIGIAGYARCGKDTFVGIAKNILSANGYTPVRVAFADKLKEEVEAALRLNKFKTTVYNEDSEAKKLIRPLLVWWGCQRRFDTSESGGLYWVDRVNDQLVELQKKTPPQQLSKIVALVSDCRFANEVNWVHNNWDGSVIHLKRYTIEERKAGQDGSDVVDVKVYDAAPNAEEAKNDPIVQELADHRVEWESKKKMTSAEAIEDRYLQGVVVEALNATKFFRHTTTGTLSQ